ncbi:PIG-L deacetylase family protein [Teichococcus oryzae]|uniref:PIG-L deacetylase family protein n=1 Tax=Teichococcus oryzae TaxID=1608942 RepID=UPI0019D5C0AF|nr:PIG-L family deacetylase [Pseudoroseomonas oryzae]
MAAELLPLRPLESILAPGGVVVLAPHPDDESLGCGGLIAAAATGRAVAVIFVSDGGASHRNSRLYPPELLRRLREEEALAALSSLGLASGAAHFLRLEDAAVPTSGAAFDAAISTILNVVQAAGAGTLLATWQHDPHCDHQATHAMAVAATRRKPGLLHLAYPVWGHTLPPDTPIPDAPRGARLDIAAQLPAKRQAIRAHRSQTTRLIDDDPEGFMLNDAMLARFDRPFEIFLEPSP